MRIIIVTSSINSLDSKLFSTSSAMYEYSLINELKIKHEIVLVSLCADETVLCDNCNIIFIPLKFDFVSQVKKLIKINSFNKECIYLFWGYDLKKVLLMKTVQILTRAPVVSFIYDSHKESIKNYPMLKKMVANLYFNIGHMIIRTFDGCILFQYKAAELLKLKNLFLVTKPGAKRIAIDKTSSYEPFVVVFAGSLTDLNGINVLLDAFSRMNDDNIHLKIYGDGPLKNIVRYYADKYMNINYFGVKTVSELLIEYSKANILLNLRNTDDICTKYAFPSKLFEIMSTGIPVVSTKVCDDEELNNKIYIINNLTSKEIINAIYYIKDNYDSACVLANSAKKYVYENYNYSKLGEEINVYLQTVMKNCTATTRYLEENTD